MATVNDERYMRLACEEGRRGLGRTSPNPPVGCVIVKKGRVVGRGFHRRAGQPHAEIEALRAAGHAARGADVYVTLEPCCHTGKTGPCTAALKEAGVRSVIAGCKDPNPLVSGRGLHELARAGVRTRVGVCETECRDLIRGFSAWVSTGRPWVELKLATSLDGRIATANGASKWLSSPASRRLVQEMRCRADAILVGVGTVLRDDPRLTRRRRARKQPLRVVLDRELRTPKDARVLREQGSCLLVCASGAPASRRRRIEAAGAEVVVLRRSGRAAWLELLRLLGSRGILEILIEGGSEVATSAIQAGVVNGVTIFYTPKLIGGDGIPMVGGLGVRDVSRAVAVRGVGVERSGSDIVWRGVFESA